MIDDEYGDFGARAGLGADASGKKWNNPVAPAFVISYSRRNLPKREMIAEVARATWGSVDSRLALVSVVCAHVEQCTAWIIAATDPLPLVPPMWITS